MSNLFVPHELADFERKAIITHTKGMRDARTMFGERESFPIDLPGRPPLFIIIIHYFEDSILAEASTQNFFHLLSESDASAPRIPKVLDAFCCRYGGVMVTEKVGAPMLSNCGISEDEAVEYAASAVRWLFEQVSAIPDEVFGRISFEIAPVCHPFFSEGLAPRAFANPDDLAGYVSRGAQHCTPKGRPSTSAMNELLISFKQSPRCIYYADIKKEQFFFDAESNQVYITDFQRVGVFPQIFQNLGLFNSSFGASVAKKLGYQPAIRMAETMAPISIVLLQSGSATLGY